MYLYQNLVLSVFLSISFETLVSCFETSPILAYHVSKLHKILFRNFISKELYFETCYPMFRNLLSSELHFDTCSVNVSKPKFQRGMFRNINPMFRNLKSGLYIPEVLKPFIFSKFSFLFQNSSLRNLSPSLTHSSSLSLPPPIL